MNQQPEYPATHVLESLTQRGKRRNYIVHRAFQLKHTVLLILLSLGGNLLMAVGILWAFRFFRLWQGSTLPTGLLAVAGVILAVNLVAAFFTGLMLSHRIAGPIYNLTRIFHRAAQGETSIRLKLRDDDEFQDAAAAFNDLMGHFQERDLATVERIQAALEALRAKDIQTVMQELDAVPAIREARAVLAATELAGPLSRAPGQAPPPPPRPWNKAG